MSRASSLARIKAAIADALGYTPVNKAGDTMTGPLILSGTQIVRNDTGFAGFEYHHASGWEAYIGTESGTGNLRFHSRLGQHNWYSNGVFRMQLDTNGRLLRPYSPAWNVGLSSQQTIINGSTVIWN